MRRPVPVSPPWATFYKGFGVPLTYLFSSLPFFLVYRPSQFTIPLPLSSSVPSPKTHTFFITSWSYIKDKDLQNPSNKREILCDDSLKAVFEKDSVTMFEMMKLMSKHFTKP